MRNRTKMKFISLISTLALLFTFVLPSFSKVSAAPNLTFNGSKNLLKVTLLQINGEDLNSPYITKNWFESLTINVEDISALTPQFFDSIKFYSNGNSANAKTLSEDVSGPEEYILEDVFLKDLGSGSTTDNLTLELYDSTSATPAIAVDEVTINVDEPNNITPPSLVYYHSDEHGALWRTSFSEPTNIEAFNGKIVLNFPKNTYIKDEFENRVFETQMIDIKAEQEVNNEDLIFQSRKFVFSAVIEDGVDNTSLIPSSPGTITIKYGNDINREVALYNLTIVKYDENFDRWYPIGGIVDTKKGTITAPITGFGTYAAALSYKTYDDLSDWSKPYIMALAYKGIIVPDYNLNDGRLKEDILADINRYDFTVMLAKALGYTPVKYDQNDNLFSDMSDYTDENGLDYIKAAVVNGLVQGKTSTDSMNNLFAPAEPLTRAEAAVFATRAMKLKVDTYSDLNKIKSSLYKYYTREDVEATPGWAAPYILAATKAKILNGNENREFEATNNLTFEEASALVYKLMDQMKLFGN